MKLAIWFFPVLLAAQTISVKTNDGVRIEDLQFRNLSGTSTAAYLVAPSRKGKFAAVLFVHWYDPESPTSNRTEFLPDATELAHHGVISLLVETPWSEPKWFPTRDVSRDWENSLQEVKELRHDLDFLLQQKGVDPKRVALVGHDFGAMYGASAAAEDKRIAALAFLAGTDQFSHWFLYNQQALSPAGKQAVVERMAPLAPSRQIAQLAGRPVLLQFGTQDMYVPKERAEALIQAASEPKTVFQYAAGHGLNPQAYQDRQAWLRRVLRLR